MPFEIPILLSNYLSPLSFKHSEERPAYFSTQTPPKMSISKYLERIYKFFQCSEQCYIMAIIYIERISKLVEINQFNIHRYLLFITCLKITQQRLLIISLIVATKFCDDKYYENSYYAKVGGIKNSELNSLELQFLELINFKLYVAEEEFHNCELAMISTSEGQLDVECPQH